jgi:hypothetical protein
VLVKLKLIGLFFFFFVTFYAITQEYNRIEAGTLSPQVKEINNITIEDKKI